jgi:hypothetical protein
VTDLQDLVLDKLVGATLGRDLPDSPLTVAAQLLEGKRPIKFGDKFNNSTMSEIARRLGWPVFLAEGAQGGVRALENEEDRRGFAMTLFRTLPVGGTPPKLAKEDMARIVAGAAAGVHPLACHEPGCPWAEQMRQLTRVPNGFDPLVVVLKCVTVTAAFPVGLSTPLYDSSPDSARLLKLTESVWNAFRKKPKTTAGYALREIVRLTVKHRGIGEAVEVIAGVARRCGLEVEM